MTATCPRCLGLIPNNLTPGAYGGACSRTDNETEICSDCGSHEADDQCIYGAATHQHFWPLVEAMA